MPILDRFFNKAAKPQTKSIEEQNLALLKNYRPSLGPIEMISVGRTRPYLALAYYAEQEVSHFSDICQKVPQEIFRNGIEWKPKFAKKCNFCSHESQEDVEVCPVCQGRDLRKPDPAQLFAFRRDENKTFLEAANYNNHTLLEVGKDFEWHLEVADNGYMLCVKNYLTDEEGNIIERIPLEFITVDPRNVEKMFDEGGRPQQDLGICLDHRDNLCSIEEQKKVCPECGKKLYPVAYKTILNKQVRYYLEEELFHTSKYFPKLVYGFPPIFKLMDDWKAYEWLEKRIRLYYEKGRPNGLVTIPTHNLEGVMAFFQKVMEKVKDDPNYTPWIGSDPEAKVAIQYLKLMDDPCPEMLEVKRDLRERMSSYFGMSNIFHSDTSASGGLNNESQQITVTNRAIEWGQSIWNMKIFPWIVWQFGITDWKLELVPNEQTDEVAEEQLLMARAQRAELMQRMGFEIVEFKQGEFKFSDRPQKPMPMAGGMPGMNMAPMDQKQPPLDSGQTQQNDGQPQESFEQATQGMEKDQEGNFNFGG